MSKQRAGKTVRDLGFAAVIWYCASRVMDQAAGWYLARQE